MTPKRDYNRFKRIFKEPDDLIFSQKNIISDREKLISIRRSEIISIAPDSINWDTIYSGKKARLHSIKAEAGASKKEPSRPGF